VNGRGGDERVIVVVKKKMRRGGHHGGSWKVAYADFVTAMMAFFLVMWIVGMESDVKDSVQGYFNNPVGFRQGYGGGASPLSSGSSPLEGPRDRMPHFLREVEERRFETARREILEGLEDPIDRGDMGPAVEVAVTAQGLRIELREREGGDTSFPFGSDAVRPAAVRALRVVAGALESLPNPIVVEGHTDAIQYGSGAYTNWELSADRANAARRVLVGAGIASERFQEVRGYADRRLLVPEDPLDASNRRVSVLVPFSAPEEGALGPDGPGGRGEVGGL